MIVDNSKIILEEIAKVFSMSDFSEVKLLADSILSSNKVVCVGAGRMGYAMKGFSMRLKHMGIDSYIIGDSNVPSIGSGDLLLIGSGSGETQTICDIAATAKESGATIALITGNPESRISWMANVEIIIRAPSKVKQIEGFASAQPMTTLNEQCVGIFFDSLVLELMKITGETHESMWGRHSNLE